MSKAREKKIIREIATETSELLNQPTIDKTVSRTVHLSIFSFLKSLVFVQSGGKRKPSSIKYLHNPHISWITVND